MKTHTITMKEAGEYLNLSKQAIYNAVKKKRLNPIKEKDDDIKNPKGFKYMFLQSDLDHYRETKFDRSVTTMDKEGRQIYCGQIISLPQASDLSNIPREHLYWAIREGKLKHKRYKLTYMLHKKDVLEYAKTYHRKEHRRKLIRR